MNEVVGEEDLVFKSSSLKRDKDLELNVIVNIIKSDPLGISLDSEEFLRELDSSIPENPKLVKEETNNIDSPLISRHEVKFLPLKVESEDEESVTKRKDASNGWLTPQGQVYVSHFLSSWGDRMWMFAGGLFLIEITPGSLRLVAIYEAALSLTVIFLGAAVGRWIDRTSRLVAAQCSLITQNLMVCLCTLLLCFMTSYKEYFEQSLYGWGEIVSQAGVVILACIAQVGTLGSKISIEKDWIVVISEDSETRLSTMNSVLRTVDLSTEMMAPVLVGFVMSSAGMVVGGIVIAVWNISSLIVEYGLLFSLYRRVESLRRPKSNVSINSKKETVLLRTKEKIIDTFQTWKSYLRHKVRDAGLGLAFLYMTVLALDNYSRAYVYENGVSKGILGILTACASLAGILGSLVFPFLRRKMGVLRTGIFGFTFQTICLLFCVASVFAPGTYFDPYSTFQRENTAVASLSVINETEIQDHITIFNNSSEGMKESVGQTTTVEKGLKSKASEDTDFTSVSLFLTGIISSRFGLWLADLTVTQILQEEVAESERGGINGVQSSLNQSFSLLRSLLLIALPTIGTFGYLIILSFFFVLIATVLFCIYSFRTRNESDQ